MCFTIFFISLIYYMIYSAQHDLFDYPPANIVVEIYADHSCTSNQLLEVLTFKANVCGAGRNDTVNEYTDYFKVNCGGDINNEIWYSTCFWGSGSISPTTGTKWYQCPSSCEKGPSMGGTYQWENLCYTGNYIDAPTIEQNSCQRYRFGAGVENGKFSRDWCTWNLIAGQMEDVNFDVFAKMKCSSDSSLCYSNSDCQPGGVQQRGTCGIDGKCICNQIKRVGNDKCQYNCHSDDICIYGVCDGNPHCACFQGYNGTTCGTCAPACSIREYCDSDNLCKCKDGFKGVGCNTFDCNPICGQNQECSGPNTCTCTSQYEGVYCTVPKCPLGCKKNETYIEDCTLPGVCTPVGSIVGDDDDDGDDDDSKDIIKDYVIPLSVVGGAVLLSIVLLIILFIAYKSNDKVRNCLYGGKKGKKKKKSKIAVVKEGGKKVSKKYSTVQSEGDLKKMKDSPTV